MPSYMLFKTIFIYINSSIVRDSYNLYNTLKTYFDIELKNILYIIYIMAQSLYSRVTR